MRLACLGSGFSSFTESCAQLKIVPLPGRDCWTWGGPREARRRPFQCQRPPAKRTTSRNAKEPDRAPDASRCGTWACRVREISEVAVLILSVLTPDPVYCCGSLVVDCRPPGDPPHIQIISCELMHDASISETCPLSAAVSSRQVIAGVLDVICPACDWPFCILPVSCVPGFFALSALGYRPPGIQANSSKFISCIRGLLVFDEPAVLATQGTWLFSFHTLRLRSHILGQVSMSHLPCSSSYRGCIRQYGGSTEVRRLERWMCGGCR